MMPNDLFQNDSNISEKGSVDEKTISPKFMAIDIQ